MITEITIYNNDGLQRVVYRVDSEQPQIIVGLPLVLQDNVNALLNYITTLKTPTEKNDIVMDFIAANATIEQKLGMINAYPEWEPGQIYKIGKELQHLGLLYSVKQAHTSQSDWTPEIVPALFTLIHLPDVIPHWVQPTGAHDAYAIGAKVLFNNKVYESLIAANTYSPTAYPAGWKLIP